MKFRLILGGLFYKKLRLFLSILGIVIGVCALFLMNSFGEAAKRKTLKEIETFGPEVLMVISGQARVRGGRALQTEQAITLKLEDVQALKKFSEIKYVSPFFSGQGIIRYQGKNLTTVLNGVNEVYLKIRKFSLLEGRNFLKSEILNSKKVAILGYKVKRELFREESAENKVILINRLPFLVIGVLAPIGIDASSQDQDDQILVPITTAMSILFNVDYLSGIYVSLSSAESIPLMEKEIESLLLNRHKVSPKDKDFTIIKAEDIFKAKEEATSLFSALVSSISLLCLLVGSLGVTGMMVLSVNERRKEIGLRIALGAERSKILKHFFIESLLVTLIGGSLGILLGLILSLIFLPLLKYPLIFPFKALFSSILLILFFGFLSGIYPAYKASQIDPAILLKGL